MDKSMVDFVEEQIVKHEWTENTDNISYGQLIVRCKDCKWWHESETNNGYGDCGQANGIALKPHDWFCADGERKDI